MQLSGGILCTLCFGAHGRHLLDLDQVRVLRQSLRLLRSGQLDVQNAILELCVDILLLHFAHIEAAARDLLRQLRPHLLCGLSEEGGYPR